MRCKTQARCASCIPAAVLQDARLKQFNEVLYLGQVHCLHPSRQFHKMPGLSSVMRCNTHATWASCIPVAVLQGAILRQWCSSAGERGRVQAAVNGLDGHGEHISKRNKTLGTPEYSRALQISQCLIFFADAENGACRRKMK